MDRGGDTKIYADDVMVVHRTRTSAIATGNVVFAQGDNRISADRAEFDTETRLGTFYNATGLRDRQAAEPQPPRPAAIAPPPVVGQETVVYFFGERSRRSGRRNTGSPTAASRPACSRRRAGICTPARSS